MNVHSGNPDGGTSFLHPPDFTGFPIASHNPFGKFPQAAPPNREAQGMGRIEEKKRRQHRREGGDVGEGLVSSEPKRLSPHRTARAPAPRVPGRAPCLRTRRRWSKGGIRSSSWLAASACCCTITTIPPAPEPLLLIANADYDWTVMAAETPLWDQERGVTLLLGSGRKGRS